MTKNIKPWEEKFDQSFVVNGHTSDWGNPTALKHFITTIIEGVINDVEVIEEIGNYSYVEAYQTKNLQQKLRSKWFGEETHEKD